MGKIELVPEDQNPLLESQNPSLPQVDNAPSVVANKPTILTQTAQNNSVPQYAGFWIRFAALIIDGILLGIPVLISAVLIGLLFNLSSTADTLQSLIFIVAVLFFVVRHGATPGKMYYGLKIVREDGSKPDFKTALMREVVGKFVSGITLNLGFIWIAFDREKQGIHDKIAKTHVILTKPLSKGRKTLIFILVSFIPIIMILGIIAAVVLISVNPAKRVNQAKDSERKSDIGQIAAALQAYHNVNQRYPQDLVGLVSSGDLKSVPIDPRGGQYKYLTVGDKSSAVVYAYLEAGEKGGFAVWCWKTSSGRAQELISDSDCKPDVTSDSTIPSDTEIINSEKWKKARDDARKSDVRQIATALQSYFTYHNNKYPVELNDLITSRELALMPVGPTGDDTYVYTHSDDFLRVSVYVVKLELPTAEGNIWCWRSEARIAEEVASASDCKP